MIRKRIKLAPEKAIFIFVDEVLPPTAALMSSIYEEHKWVLFRSCCGCLCGGRALEEGLGSETARAGGPRRESAGMSDNGVGTSAIGRTVY